MSTLLIEGGHRLGGRVSVEGNKNAALPLLAACLLTDEECVLTNVPRIGDVEVMARLLLDLGVEVHGIGTTTLRICAKQVRTHAPNRSLVGRLRGSVLLLGPLLGVLMATSDRLGEVLHLDQLEAFVTEMINFATSLLLFFTIFAMGLSSTRR